MRNAVANLNSMRVGHGDGVADADPEGQPNVGLMTAISNVLAYLLGPIAFADPPPWPA